MDYYALVSANAVERLRESIQVLYKVVAELDGQTCLDDESHDTIRKQVEFANKQVNNLMRGSKPKDGDVVYIWGDPFEVKAI